MRKPTGEKPGRPPKAKSLAIRKRNARAQNLTPLQKRVVDTAIVKLKAPDWRDISPTELALASGAKKQTVFKWRRDAVIERYFNRRLSLKRARAKRLRTHHLTQRFIARLIKRDAERDGPRQRATHGLVDGRGLRAWRQRRHQAPFPRSRRQALHPRDHAQRSPRRC